MLNRTTIQAGPRALFGKRCRYLRRAGLLPANLYGAGIESIPIQVEISEVIRILSTTSRNTPLQIVIPGEEAARMAFVWGVQREPVTGAILHIDFYHVEALRHMRAHVPLVLVNVDPNLEKLDRRINTMLHFVEVDTLPIDLPTQIDVDGTRLVELDSEVKVRDLIISERVQILTHADIGVARVIGIVSAAGAEAPDAGAAEPGAAEPETVERRRRQAGEP